jgi:hypothetical protein
MQQNFSLPKLLSHPLPLLPGVGHRACRDTSGPPVLTDVMARRRGAGKVGPSKEPSFSQLSRSKQQCSQIGLVILLCPLGSKGSTLASWLSWDELTTRRIRESDPSMRQLPDASNSDYNDLSTHATKTYHQLHESYYPKDKFENNDYHASNTTSSTQNLHEKWNNPTQKAKTNLRLLHEIYTKPNKQPKSNS